jgi:hypothetical protein
MTSTQDSSRHCSGGQHVAPRIGNKLEKDAIEVETSDLMSRRKAESEDVAIKRDRVFHVSDVVVDGIKFKLEFWS